MIFLALIEPLFTIDLEVKKCYNGMLFKNGLMSKKP